MKARRVAILAVGDELLAGDPLGDLALCPFVQVIWRCENDPQDGIK